MIGCASHGAPAVGAANVWRRDGEKTQRMTGGGRTTIRNGGQAMTDSRLPPRHALWEQAVRAWQWGKWAFAAVAATFALMTLAQAWNLVHAAWTVHPACGVAVALALLSAMGWLVGRPLAAYLRRPKVAEPPTLPEDRPPTPQELRRVVKYLGRALVAAEANPELAETRKLLAPARVELAAWDAKLAAAPADQGAALERELAKWCDRSMDPIWAPADAKAEQAIHAEALNIGLATALSPNGTLDAYLMLWRATHLASRIAELHYGRPGFVGSLCICRDVAVATAVAG